MSFREGGGDGGHFCEKESKGGRESVREQERMSE